MKREKIMETDTELDNEDAMEDSNLDSSEDNYEQEDASENLDSESEGFAPPIDNEDLTPTEDGSYILTLEQPHMIGDTFVDTGQTIEVFPAEEN